MERTKAFDTGRAAHAGVGKPPANLSDVRAWNMTANIYHESKQVVLLDNCFGFMFTNVGDVVAQVNGMTIFPNATPLTALGDSRTVAAHREDIYLGNITLKFIPGAGANPAVEIVQLYYLEANPHTRR